MSNIPYMYHFIFLVNQLIAMKAQISVVWLSKQLENLYANATLGCQLLFTKSHELRLKNQFIDRTITLKHSLTRLAVFQ